MIASAGEVAMFSAISNFTTVNRAALFAARVAVSAPVSRSVGGIWGVSDPLCHPPDTAPCFSSRGSLTPQMHVAVVRQNRALSFATSECAACLGRGVQVIRVDCERVCQVLPGNCVHIGERALPPNRRPRQHPRCHLMTVSQPCASARRVRSPVEHRRSFTSAAITRPGCSAVLGPVKPLRFAPSLVGRRA